MLDAENAEEKTIMKKTVSWETLFIIDLLFQFR